MPDFDSDQIIASTTSSPPPLCEATHCRTYKRREHDGSTSYGRGYGYLQVNDRFKKPRWICQACYLFWADVAGISVNAQLLRDPESILSRVRDEKLAWERAQQDEREYRNRRDNEI